MLFLILFFVGCKKTDIGKDDTPEDALSSRFFQLPTVASVELKAIAQKIRLDGEKTKKLPDLIEWAGFPRWDKVRVVESSSTATGRTTSGNTDKLYYVPFVKDSSRRVGAILEVKLKGTDTLYKMIYIQQYKRYGYDTTKGINWNARNIFQLFTSFDNYVFGHTKFLIKDKQLFQKKRDSAQLHFTLKQNRANGVNTSSRSTLFAVEECTTYEVCEKYPVAYARGLSLSDGCSNTWYFDICTTYYYDDGGGSTGGGSDGSGGGSGGAGDGIFDDPPCYPTPPTAVERNYYTECADDGWEPEPKKDCNGVINGTAYWAPCGCIGGTTGRSQCPPPCNTFENRVQSLLKHEGGFVDDPNDPGGTTNKGITWQVWLDNASSMLGKTPTLENLKNLSNADVEKLYKGLYWDKINIDQVKDGDLRWLLFDFYVNAGGNAVIVLQKTLNQIGASVSVDGGMGAQTMAAINAADPTKLYNTYKANRQNYYNRIVVKNLKLAKFLKGWTNRVNSFEDKSPLFFQDVNCI